MIEQLKIQLTTSETAKQKLTEERDNALRGRAKYYLPNQLVIIRPWGSDHLLFAFFRCFKYRSQVSPDRRGEHAAARRFKIRPIPITPQSGEDQS